jgi:O-antigen ligase
MTLIYGKSIWIALDKSMESISKDFSIHSQLNFSYWIIGIYVLIHVSWGILIGAFSGKLPRLIEKHTPVILNNYQNNEAGYALEQQSVPKRKNKNIRWLSFLLILVFILVVFLWSGAYSDYKILYVIVRSVAAVLLLFFVLRPIMTWAIQYWLKKQRTETKQEAMEVMALMPGLRNFVKPSWQIAKTNRESMGRLRYFILSMIILTLHHEQH